MSSADRHYLSHKLKEPKSTKHYTAPLDRLLLLYSRMDEKSELRCGACARDKSELAPVFSVDVHNSKGKFYFNCDFGSIRYMSRNLESPGRPKIAFKITDDSNGGLLTCKSCENSVGIRNVSLCHDCQFCGNLKVFKTQQCVDLAVKHYKQHLDGQRVINNADWKPLSESTLFLKGRFDESGCYVMKCGTCPPGSLSGPRPLCVFEYEPADGSGLVECSGQTALARICRRVPVKRAFQITGRLSAKSGAMYRCCCHMEELPEESFAWSIKCGNCCRVLTYNSLVSGPKSANVHYKACVKSKVGRVRGPLKLKSGKVMLHGIISDHGKWWFRCGQCGLDTNIFSGSRLCEECGEMQTMGKISALALPKHKPDCSVKKRLKKENEPQK